MSPPQRSTWLCESPQQQVFEAIKWELATPAILSLYNPSVPTNIAADASAYGLGAVLLQLSNSVWKTVTFASRSVMDTEGRYSQIEKEALALVWACETFSDYVIGKHITLETDHKPLVPLLGKTNLDSLLPQILRFQLCLMRFSYNIHHIPDKDLYTADTLSRAPLSKPSEEHIAEGELTKSFFSAITSVCSATGRHSCKT